MSSEIIGSTVVITNNQEEVLLHLRDNNPDIPFPNMWGLPGGHSLAGEDSFTCIIREIQEELGVTINPRFLYFFEDNDGVKAAYHTGLELDPTQIIVNEGLHYQWFRKGEISHMQLAFKANQILETFFQGIEVGGNVNINQ